MPRTSKPSSQSRGRGRPKNDNHIGNHGLSGSHDEALQDEDQIMLKMAELNGFKLAFYISALDVSDEIKQSLLTIAQDMDLGQLQELLDVLEARYLNFSTSWLEKGFEHELAQVNAGYDKKESDMLTALTRQLQASSKEIQEEILKTQLH